ncbi:MAG: hypothetical protein ACSHWN_04530 [Methylophilaceae bacterium]
MPKPRKAKQPNIAPWPDFAGNPIHEGDCIIHPSGQNGIVIYKLNAEDIFSQWLVDYGDGDHPSRLCLQIGNKGRAIAKAA